MTFRGLLASFGRNYSRTIPLLFEKVAESPVVFLENASTLLMFAILLAVTFLRLLELSLSVVRHLVVPFLYDHRAFCEIDRGCDDMKVPRNHEAANVLAR